MSLSGKEVSVLLINTDSTQKTASFFRKIFEFEIQWDREEGIKKSRESDRQELQEGRKCNVQIYKFTPYILTATWVERGWSWELGIQSRFPIGVAGAQPHESSEPPHRVCINTYLELWLLPKAELSHSNIERESLTTRTNSILSTVKSINSRRGEKLLQMY